MKPRLPSNKRIRYAGPGFIDIAPEELERKQFVPPTTTHRHRNPPPDIAALNIRDAIKALGEKGVELKVGAWIDVPKKYSVRWY